MQSFFHFLTVCSDPPKNTSANLERALVYAMKRLPAFTGITMMSDGRKILYSLQQLEKVLTKSAGTQC